MRQKIAYYLRVASTLLLITSSSVVMLFFSIATLGIFRRKHFVWIMSPFASAILRVWNLRMELRPALPSPERQTVFLMNHTSTIDIFAIVAAGLPNTRFFLSGYLRKFPPFAVLGYLTGTFWTVKQTYPEQRKKIFQRACETLKRTGQNVCLSPEGTRVTTGKIGPFNKGAFHLAAALHAPVQPIFIEIAKKSDPGIGWQVKPGTVHIWIAEPIDTSQWRPEDAGRIKNEMWQYYVDWKAKIDGREGVL